ncbi:hypothetical protein [Amycolatopsis sp. 195334CR]|uniref:hypothetical protein n=1 Tax=Amycolatopsis sp. 195334CR TaxID=2814588 RepID=UPI001A8C981A|nr:hypothetical protein [Amycolatopsis sp. 195334CR]MBN6034079.1 hypothetical protein [Amycolatopsis sp. 195334CR]
MNTTVAAFLGALAGGTGTFLAAFVTARSTAKREHRARLYTKRSEIYIDLLKHLDELFATAFSDSVAFDAFTPEGKKYLLAKRHGWYLDMELNAPSSVRNQSEAVVGSLNSLGDARESATVDYMNLNNGANPSQFDIAHHEKVQAAEAAYEAERSKLIELIKKDLDIKQ